MSAIDELLKELDDHYNDPLGMVIAARAELAALRATTSELEEANRFVHLANDLITELRATVEAQARQLEEAREAIQPFAIIGDVFVKQYPHDNSIWTKLPDNQMVKVGWNHLIVTINDLRRASAWLAANAPAPQAQPAQRVTAEDK